MGQAVEHGPGKAFRSADFGPVFKGQIGRNNKAGAFIGSRDHIEEQFGPGFGERHIPQFIEDQQVVPLQLLEHPLELTFFAGLQESGYQAGDGKEPDLSALAAGGEGQCTGQMGLSRAAVAHQQDIFMSVHVFAGHQLSNQGLVNGGLNGEVEGIEGLDHGEPGSFDPSFGGPAFPVDQLPFRQSQQIARIVTAVPGTGRGEGRIVSEHGGQFELLEMMIQ